MKKVFSVAAILFLTSITSCALLPTSYLEVEAPTCVDNGYQVKVVKGQADYNQKIIIPALGHNYQEATVTLEPTHKDNGVKTSVCNNPNCHSVIEYSIPKIEHSVTDSTFYKDATNHWQLCECGEVLNKTTHSFPSTYSIKTNDDHIGVETRIYQCNDCGYQKEEIIQDASHIINYSIFYSSPSEHWNQCSCGYKLNVSTHSFDDGVVTLPPTTVQEGTKTYTCQTCGYHKNEPIPKLEESSGDSGYLTGYYSDASNLSGSQLKLALRTITTSTYKSTSYDQLKQILPESDEDPNNPNNMILFYSRASIKKKYSCGNGISDWNREHVWPKANGGFQTSGPGADPQHLRPTNADINSNRGNRIMGEIKGSYTTEYFEGSPTGNKYTGSNNNSGTYEPADHIKGDVARIYLYMMTRWSELDTSNYMNRTFTSIDMLLRWNELDPVDNLEINRNNYINEVYGGNRNPFIDHPEFAKLIWGK